MKCLVPFITLFLLVSTMIAQDAENPPATQEDAPYIYYYSEALNGVVIERADGTDSRIIGQGLVDEDVLFTYGPGWSPDGRWFAWRVWTPERVFGSAGKGYVISADGETTLDLLERFQCADSMLWHPTDNIFLVYGTIATEHICPQRAYPASFWLIDADTQTRLATFSIDSYQEWQSTPPIYWNSEQRQIQFPEATWINDSFALQEFLVTMSFDGTVTMEPMSGDEVRTRLEGIEPDISAYQDRQLTLFTRWNEFTAERTLSPPPNSSAAGGPVAGQWDSSGRWLFIGYEFCFADCSGVTGRVNVFNPETGYNREISACGAHPTCVAWLPERVRVADLPPGQPTSVLPTPQSMDYSTGFLGMTGSYGWLTEVAIHQLVCNLDVLPPVLNLIQNKRTGEVDFVIPNGGSCGEPLQVEPELIFPREPIVFALSPDGRYYAVTDRTRYTSLYDADTGERIATLNFYGIELAFSEDSRTLVTTGRYATATWDIQDLEER